MSEGGSSWWAVVGWPAVAASVPGAIAVWQWWGNLREKRESRSQTLSERRDAALLAERELISKEQSDIYKRLEEELERAMVEKDRLRAQRRDLERDRDRGWDIARWWYRRAYELQHAGFNAQQAAQALAKEQGLTPPQWADLSLPNLEDPFPVSHLE